MSKVILYNVFKIIPNSIVGSVDYKWTPKYEVKKAKLILYENNGYYIEYEKYKLIGDNNSFNQLSTPRYFKLGDVHGTNMVGAVEIDGEMYNINRIAENPEAFSAKLENLELENCIDQLS